MLTVLLATVLVAGAVSVVTVAPRPAAAATARQTAIDRATSYGRSHGYKVGIAVFDTKTGQLLGNKYKRATFASESVIKVMIAARLILQGRMHGKTSARAKRMIACSNDGIATSFYGSVGGDSLLSWTKKRFKVPSLGSGPIRRGWWGSNRITAEGLVRLYAKLKANKRIGPWLLRAMHAHTLRGCDGFDQSFGLPKAARNVAVKQGWGGDYSYRTSNASQNSTGFVNGDRYAIAILARGPGSTYGPKIGRAITTMAKRLLPKRAYPSGKPVLTSLTRLSGPAVGGVRVTLRGREFAKTKWVTFGGNRARIVKRGDNSLLVSTPVHRPGLVRVVVGTQLGTSNPRSFRYLVPPKPKPRPTPTPSAASTGP